MRLLLQRRSSRDEPEAREGCDREEVLQRAAAQGQSDRIGHRVDPGVQDGAGGGLGRDGVAPQWRD